MRSLNGTELLKILEATDTLVKKQDDAHSEVAFNFFTGLLWRWRADQTCSSAIWNKPPRKIDIRPQCIQYNRADYGVLLSRVRNHS